MIDRQRSAAPRTARDRCRSSRPSRPRDPAVPLVAGGRQRPRRDHALKAGVGGEREQVAELEAGAEHPEPGVGEPEQAEGRQPDPVRRDEHAERPGVERGGQVVQETGFLGHQLFGRLLIGIYSDSRSGAQGPGLRSQRLPGLCVLRPVRRLRILRPVLQRHPACERRLQLRADRVDARQDGADVVGGRLVERRGRRLVLQALPLGLERLDVRRQRLELAAFLEGQFPLRVGIRDARDPTPGSPGLDRSRRRSRIPNPGSRVPSPGAVGGNPRTRRRTRRSGRRLRRRACSSRCCPGTSGRG